MTLYNITKSLTIIDAKQSQIDTLIQENDKLKCEIDNFDKIKIKVKALENQMTIMTNKLYDKEEVVNTANAKIISLEENKNIIEEKLISYRATLRKLIKEKEEGKKENKVEDKGRQK